MSAFEQRELAERLHAILRDLDGEPSLRSIRLIAALDNIHPADIAEAMNRLELEDALAVFRVLDIDRAAEVLDELDADTARFVLDNDVPGRIAGLLDLLPMDDAARIMAEAQEVDPERAEAILEVLAQQAPEDAAEVRELLSYKEQTAGRLMTDKCVRILPTIMVEEAFAAIRHAPPDVELLSTIYVTEPVTGGEEVLIGVVGLRDLVRSEPSLCVRDLMIVEPISVTVDTDQEEVANLISKYDLSALPVVDRRGRFAGIVTVDDVVDILIAEQTEDALRQGAVEPDDGHMPYFATPVSRVVRSRVTWLLLLFAAGTLTIGVGSTAKGELDTEPLLAVFMPLLIGMGGNTGAQTVSTVIRGLSLREIRGQDTGRVLWKELSTGLLLGFLLGLIGFAFTYITQRRMDMAMVVALSIWAICLWANVVGALVPLAAQKLKIDPALVSAPLITTLVDATGLAIYFGIAKWLLAALK